MNLKILVPTQIFADKADVQGIVAETTEGSIGLLPHRRDCVAALIPGVLIYKTKEGRETYVALDEGVLLKSGLDVSISSRRAHEGTDLARLVALVDTEFQATTDQEKLARSATKNIESQFLSRLVRLKNE